jgi:hypothetical protein
MHENIHHLHRPSLPIAIAIYKIAQHREPSAIRRNQYGKLKEKRTYKFILSTT